MLKKILLALPLFIVSIVFFLTTACSLAVYNLASSIISGNSGGFKEYFPTSSICTPKNSIIKKFPDLFANKTYVVLLQNNTELRASGGFIGSYARIHFDEGVLKDLLIQDIYVPDGQLKGYVLPPLPLQQAFRTGDWRLRNANWNVDFRQAARDTAWFFEKGGENPDGIIALNLGLIKEWLKVIGPVRPYSDVEVNSDNFYELAQSKAEENFFPGSLQKQAFLGSVATALWDKSIHADGVMKLKLALLIKQQLDTGQIFLWSKDEELQREIENLGWSGKLQDYSYDYLYSVESNLGANKANCCIERSITHQISVGNITKEELIIDWKNNNPFPSPVPPSSWGGDYVNYHRVVLPLDTTINELSVNGIIYQKLNEEPDFHNPPNVEDDTTYTETIQDNYKIIGFWVVIPALQENKAIIKYELPRKTKLYQLSIQTQPGIYALPYKLTVNNNIIVETELTKNTIFSASVE